MSDRLTNEDEVVTAYITIGNSDDKLSQNLWHLYCRKTEGLVKLYAQQVFIAGYSLSNAKHQNAIFGFAITRRGLDDGLVPTLREVARTYKQDSIALVVGNTEMIRAATFV